MGLFAIVVNANDVHVVPSVEVAKTGWLLLFRPSTTNRPVELTAIAVVVTFVGLPPVVAGVVHVEPLEEVAKTAVPDHPTATNKPDELTATDVICANALDPFMRAGVVHVEPLEEVANTGASLLSYPTATNKPDELTATDSILA
jgi:hypothetical protein